MRKHGYIFLFLAEFTFYISGYVVQMGAGRLLGPEDYGRFVLVMTLALLVANLIGSAIPIAMSKFLGEVSTNDPQATAEVRRQSARAQGRVMAVVTGVFLALSPIFSYALGDMTLMPLFLISSLLIPLYGAETFYAYLFSGMRLFSVQSALKFTRAFLRITVILGCTYFFALKGIFLGYILVPVGVLMVAWVLERRVPEMAITRTVSDTHTSFTRKIYALAVPITIFAVFFEALISFDVYVLKYFFEDDALLGQYGASLTIARIPSFLFYALTLILLPNIANAFATLDASRAKQMVENALRFMVIVGALFVAYVFAYPEAITRVFFGKEFLAGAEFLPVLATSIALLSVLYVMSFAYSGAGKIGIPIRLVVSALVLNGALSFILLPLLGAEVVPYLKFITALAITPILFVSIQRIFGARLSLIDLGKVFFSALVVFFIARFFGDSMTMLFALALPLIALYFGMLLFLRVIRREDFSKA